MSDDSDDAPPPDGGRRKDGRPSEEGNTREDGSYADGKNRPPASGQFAAGDGRRRGMSDDSDDAHPPDGGRRKDGRPFKEGNTREDGGYAVGRNRPPASGQFAAGDGRRRGRRAKGVRNADTEFERELARKIIIKENGVERKVSRSLAIDLRLIDNAARKGDTRSIELVDQRRRRIAAAHESNRRNQTLADQEIVDAWVRERAVELAIDPDLFGDPDPLRPPEGAAKPDEENSEDGPSGGGRDG